jgi:hypothetical protein
MVPGVLHKNGTADAVMPFQAIIVADKSDAAIEIFAKAAQHDYPGHRLIGTLASSVPAAGSC